MKMRTVRGWVLYSGTLALLLLVLGLPALIMLQAPSKFVDGMIVWVLAQFAISGLGCAVALFKMRSKS